MYVHSMFGLWPMPCLCISFGGWIIPQISFDEDVRWSRKDQETNSAELEVLPPPPTPKTSMAKGDPPFEDVFPSWRREFFIGMLPFCGELSEVAMTWNLPERWSISDEKPVISENSVSQGPANFLDGVMVLSSWCFFWITWQWQHLLPYDYGIFWCSICTYNRNSTYQISIASSPNIQ